MKTFIRRVGLVAGLGALLALSAGPVAAQENAMIRVLHASPDAPAVDIWIDGAPNEDLQNVPFGTLSDYLSVPEGTYNVQVFATGTDMNPVIDANVDVEAGMSYTIAAINEVASIEPKVLVDDPALDYDKALVRIVHFSPDAPAVDIAPDGAEALIPGLAFPDDTGYAALDPGTYDLEVRVAGTDTVALQLDPIDLMGGRAYSVFAIGSAAEQPLGGNELQVVIALDAEMLPDTAVATDGATEGIGMTTFALLAGVAVAAFIVLGFYGRSRFARQTTR
jgi:hypothetical protein